MGQSKSKLRQSVERKSFMFGGRKAMKLDRDSVDVNSMITTEDYENVTPLWLAAR